jgi:hypothetical protein
MKPGLDGRPPYTLIRRSVALFVTAKTLTSVPPDTERALEVHPTKSALAAPVQVHATMNGTRWLFMLTFLRTESRLGSPIAPPSQGGAVQSVIPTLVLSAHDAASAMTWT